MMKICLVASRGGHLEELQFVKYMDIECQYCLITENSPEVLRKKISNVYYVDQINRKDSHILLKIIKLIFTGIRIIKKENPDCFISTGALIAIPILILAKLYRRKVIFIETFARVDSGSLSGRIAYLFADVFIVYWKSLLKIYPKAKYIDPFEEKLNDINDSGDTKVSF
mgnify:CR=1 FL=1